MYEHLAFVLSRSRFVESVSLILNADCLLITRAARVCQINPPLLHIAEAGARGHILQGVPKYTVISSFGKFQLQ